MEDFKIEDESFFLSKLDDNNEGNADIIQIDQETEFRINTLVENLFIASNNSEVSIVKDLIKELLSILAQFPSRFSLVESLISPEFVSLLSDYITRNSDPSTTVNASQIVCIYSAQQQKYSYSLKQIIPKLARKLRQNTHEYEYYIVSTLANLMNDAEYKTFFDNYDISEFNTYVDTIKNVDEAIAIAKFYYGYVTEEVPDDLLKLILYRLPLLMNILPDEFSSHILKILIQIIIQNGLDADFFLKSNFLGYIEHFSEHNMALAIFIKSLLLKTYPESISALNIDINQLIEALTSNHEESDEFELFEIAICALLNYYPNLTDEQMLLVINWMMRSHCSFILRQNIFILLNSFMRRFSAIFISQIEVISILDILDSILECIEKIDHFTFACECFTKYIQTIQEYDANLVKQAIDHPYVGNLADSIVEYDFDNENPTIQKFFVDFIDVE